MQIAIWAVLAVLIGSVLIAILLVGRIMKSDNPVNTGAHLKVKRGYED